MALTIRKFYEREGYAGPFTAISAAEITRLGILHEIEMLRSGVDATERRWSRNRHLDVPSIARLCRHESVIEHANAILGPDLLLWRSQVWGFRSNELGLEWHRDSYDHVLQSSPGQSCSVQINLIGSSKINCLAIIPRSHAWDTEALRARGYTAGPGVNFPEWRIPRHARVIDLPMKAGEFFIFHSGLLHASVWSRTLRTAGTGQLGVRFARFTRRVAASVMADSSMRYSLTLRLATPAATVLPEAFLGVPDRAKSVLLSGADAFGLNSLGPLAPDRTEHESRSLGESEWT